MSQQIDTGEEPSSLHNSNPTKHTHVIQMHIPFPHVPPELVKPKLYPVTHSPPTPPTPPRPAPSQTPTHVTHSTYTSHHTHI